MSVREPYTKFIHKRYFYNATRESALRELKGSRGSTKWLEKCAESEE